MQTSSLFAVVAALYTVVYLSGWVRNYITARKTGLPCIVTPVDTTNLGWMIFSIPLEPLLRKVLPQWMYDRLAPTIYGWEHKFKYKYHAKWGSSFWLVQPKKNELWTVDPVLATDMLLRRNDFVQSEISAKIMGRFGQNLVTSNGEDWQRHRRLIAPNINERISAVVWRESREQAAEMADAMMSGEPLGSNKDATFREPGASNAVLEGCRRIAINVLGSAGYGTPREWKEDISTPPPGHEQTFIEGLIWLSNYLVVATFIPPKILRLPFMPLFLRSIGTAVEDFSSHSKELIEKEQSMTGERNNILSNLAKVAARNVSKGEKVARSANCLLQEEVEGNLYLVTLAGYDTTANTLAYAMVLLAIHPEWQQWIIVEIDAVRDAYPSGSYGEIYPHLKRALALMFETLRMYTPIQHLVREISAPQTVPTESGEYVTIPENTVIYFSSQIVHYSPKVYGADVDEYRPSRWLRTTSSMPPAPMDPSATLVEMPKGTFMPWSQGPRYCPGMKMAQVEFVAIMYEIFQSHRIEPFVPQGGSMAEERAKLEAVLLDSTPRVSMQINRPKDVKLRWTKR